MFALVTGVQTWALPISAAGAPAPGPRTGRCGRTRGCSCGRGCSRGRPGVSCQIVTCGVGWPSGDGSNGGGWMGLSDLRVMVVEDHGFQRRMALRLLAEAGVGATFEAADEIGKAHV